MPDKLKRKDQFTWNGYISGHPWYYVLGGTILTPKQIMSKVQMKEYKGYMWDAMQAADNKPEPQRSEALREIWEKVLKDYRSDLSTYRKYVHKLRRYRRENFQTIDRLVCEDIHVSISLKHNHLYNDFAHLIRLHDLLSYQPDLFAH